MFIIGRYKKYVGVKIDTRNRRERDEALRERDAARKQLAARNDMLAQVLKEQQY